VCLWSLIIDMLRTNQYPSSGMYTVFTAPVIFLQLLIILLRSERSEEYALTAYELLVLTTITVGLYYNISYHYTRVGYITKENKIV